VLDTETPTRPGTPAGVTRRPGGPRISEADLRAFYDPAGHWTDRPVQVLLDDVAGTRASPVLPGAGRLSGYEVVLAEALHACLGTDARAGVGLPVPPRRRRAVTRAVVRQTGAVAEAVTGLAGELARSRWRRPRARHRDERLVFAGRVLAAVAHDGVVRRNGRAYFTHPDEVAAILTAAWPDPGHPRLQIARFLAYCHDTFEETLDPVGAYLGRPVVVSPRVALAVLRRLGVPDAAAVARVLLLMTRTTATSGGRTPYLEHVERGIREGGGLFLVTKTGDVHHNLTIEPERLDPDDPRAPARHRKRSLYRQAVTRLQDAADADDPGTARVVRGILTVRRSDLPASPRSGGAHLHHLATAARDRATALAPR
jgi:hypothetical protein